MSKLVQFLMSLQEEFESVEVKVGKGVRINTDKSKWTNEAGGSVPERWFGDRSERKKGEEQEGGYRNRMPERF